MARIRTIKPEFFRHLELFKAEIEEKLPLRIAFAGLWTSCDREGRFKWEPIVLKLDCLPFDNCDFSRVLDALMTRGFIVKYQVENRYFGFIPSWKDHQFINNREIESNLPEPNDNNILTCGARVNDASVTRDERDMRGRERKGKEGKGITRQFIPPTLEEVKEYFFEKGYKESVAIKAFDSYSVADWVDSKGNKVKNWKQKMINVWFKEENEITKTTLKKIKITDYHAEMLK